MSEKTKNVFISHIHADDSRLDDLKSLMEKGGYSIRDGSIDSRKPNNAQDPDYIKREILAPRIKWAGTLIVLISKKTCESEYVNWEIEYAQKNNTRIVGVYDRGAQESDLPDAFHKFGDALVGWQTDRVMDAVNGKINNFFTPDGKEFERRPISRYDC